MGSSRQLRIGIIGLGIGMRHASSLALVPEAKIVAMADPAPNRLGVTVPDFCAHYGATPYADGFEMLEKEHLDAVCICTNPKLHLPFVEEAARAGMHVLVEKPMAGTVEDCEAMIAACKKAGVHLAMEFPMRQLEPMVDLRRLLDDGTLGTPFLAGVEYVCGPRPGPPWLWTMGDGGTVINENTCHAIDSAMFLLGPVAKVHAAGGNWIGHGAPLPDTAACTLHFANGGVATVIGGGGATNEMGIKPRISLYCTEGQAYVEGVAHTYHYLRWARRGGEPTERDYSAGNPPTMSNTAGSFGRYPLLEPALKNFVEDILSGRPPRATGEEGAANVRVCLAIIESIGTGQPVAIA